MNIRAFLFPQGSKLWVGSTRTGPRTGAVLVATSGTDPDRVVQLDRPPEPVATVGDLAQFYPGSLALPSAGTWTSTVQIGPDTGCFTFEIPA